MDEQQKHRTLQDQVSIFNGINTSLIEQIYDELDEKSPDSARRTHLYTNMALTQCRRRGSDTELVFDHCQTGERYRFMTDEIVFATGYCYRIPDFMQGIADRLSLTRQGRYRLAQDYAADVNGDEVYIQNAGFDSHGLTNPDLGLNCFRNACIINAIMKREVYAIDTGTTFQAFTPQENSQFAQLSDQ
ncbi:MAG TPA: hypothetical protein DD666_21485 [Advenella kashmirensis]|uniref:Uncharacterized protein n=1 Tax=Advenella kashmirensis TaxID=310575 RepID=A0A356LML6_9BURK|nr:hypothetical protein [Advenella kashmirensis]